MADKTISALTAVTSLSDNDVFPLDNAAGNTRKATLATLRSAILDLVQPTIAGTGLSTTVGTSAAAADSAAGIFISNTTTNGAFIRKSSPGTPYTITAKLSVAGPQGGSLGWSDGTKYQIIYLTKSNGTISVQSNSAIGSFAATNATVAYVNPDCTIYLRIRDDGTNVIFSFGTDGVNFIQAYSVAKSSGYLGSSGYSNVVVGGSGGAIIYMTVLEWTETT